MKNSIRILIIAIPAYGDCLISLDWLRWLTCVRSTGINLEIDFLTYQEFLPLVKDNPDIQNVYLWHEQRKYGFFQKWKYWLRQTVKIHRRHYDLILKNPDGRQIGSWILSLLLSITHGGLIIFRKQTAEPTKLISYVAHRIAMLSAISVIIPESVVNVYDVQKYVIERLFHQPLNDSAMSHYRQRSKEIAFHPLASLPCKQWPLQNWVRLVQMLNFENPIIIFCAPEECSEIQMAFASISDKICLCAYDIPNFLATLKTIDILVCLDSMAVHAGYYLNVPHLIMLNGAYDPRYYAPPGTIVLHGQTDKCQRSPCSNSPTCEGTDFEYACLRSISVETVYDAILASINMINKENNNANLPLKGDI
jgi:ADP-heptose:LPS heptosyltransferase